MNKNKKNWKKPHLIIIGQGKPEESVLTNCKSHAQPNSVISTASRTNCNEVSGSCAGCRNNGGGIS